MALVYVTRRSEWDSTASLPLPLPVCAVHLQPESLCTLAQRIQENEFLGFFNGCRSCILHSDLMRPLHLSPMLVLPSLQLLQGASRLSLQSTVSLDSVLDVLELSALCGVHNW